MALRIRTHPYPWSPHRADLRHARPPGQDRAGRPGRAREAHGTRLLTGDRPGAITAARVASPRPALSSAATLRPSVAHPLADHFRRRPAPDRATPRASRAAR